MPVRLDKTDAITIGLALIAVLLLVLSGVLLWPAWSSVVFFFGAIIVIGELCVKKGMIT